MVVLHSLDTNSETPEINLLIRAIGSTTMKGAYLESLVNFGAYYLTLMDRCLRLMNSVTLTSLSVIVKNQSKKAHLNYSYLVGPTS